MPSTDDLKAWDAVETAERIRAGDVSARQVIEAAIERAKAAAPLAAMVTPAFEQARAALRSTRGPLAGVPTFIKDLVKCEGVRTTWGSRGSGTYVSTKSDPIARRIAETGLVSLGKSATPELGLTGTTEPLGFAPCRNPYNPEHSAGGSSGGAAALVAAGVVPVAHGSDGGGSIRIPASCCGLVGLKVSRGRLDVQGSWLLPVNVGVDGCVSRTVRDTLAFFDALESRRPPRRLAPIGTLDRAAPERLRMGVFVDAPIGTPVHEANRRATLAAAERCRELGHQVDDIDCPFEGQVIDDFLCFWGGVAWGQKVTAKLMLHPGFDTRKLEPWTDGLSRGFSSSPLAGMRAAKRLRGFAKRYAEVLSRYDVLVSPTTASPPPKLGYLAPDVPFDTAFERLREYLPFTPLHNVAGAPALSLPLGVSDDGLPIGVMFASAVGRERTLLELGLELEQAVPWQPLAPRPA